MGNFSLAVEAIATLLSIAQPYAFLQKILLFEVPLPDTISQFTIMPMVFHVRHYVDCYQHVASWKIFIEREYTVECSCPQRLQVLRSPTVRPTPL